MTESYEHNPGDHEDPMAGPTWLIGFMGAVMVLVIVFGVSALYRMTQQETFEDVSVTVEPAELMSIRAAEAERLSAGPHYEEYLDADGALQMRLVIPLEEAMGRVSGEAKGRR